jgi:ABC-2 type transport system ATP-binding protein
VLELNDLYKRFGDTVALDGVSMRISPGRVHGFVGRNGAGKTTTMRIALGVLRPDSGDVRWEGRAVGPADVRSFGSMPEERGLFPSMTARAQVAFFGELSGMGRGDAAAAAERVLAELGLGDRCDEAVEALSLGNQQRVQLAIALVAQPPLLVLDEPFSGLDPVGVDVLAGVLRGEVNRGAAVVFSSHQLELVERFCDEVTIIDAGRVVASGTIAELRASRRPGQRLRVGLDGGWTAWADGLDSARLVSVDGDEVVVELLPGADDQAVLDAARAAGRVRTFGREEPSLTELFREVVAA